MAKRELWNSRKGFIYAAVGAAIGLGNLWRFPFQAYKKFDSLLDVKKYLEEENGK